MEKDNRANRYSPETRARAVRMVLDNQGSYESRSAAIKAIAEIGDASSVSELVGTLQT